MIAIAVFISVLALVLIIFLYRIIAREEKEKKFICPKTGYKYVLLCRCKMKCPDDRGWRSAVIYQGVHEDGKLYVMERDEFLNTYVKLTEYKDGTTK